jgi:LysM repeat protein
MRGPTSAIFTALALLTLLLASCGGGGGGSVAENRSSRGYNPGVGPFDSRGNYVDRWANDKSKGVKWRKSTSSGSSSIAAVTPPVIASNTTPTPRPTARPTSPRPRPPVGGTATPTPRPKTTVASRPKPRPTVKVKPKRKPPIRHTIKKGDTLWGISRKYKTSVTAIQRANGLKGTNLKIGRRLLIPRY